MSVDLKDLYGAHAELEGIPAKANAESTAASAARSAAVAAAESTRKSTNQAFDGRAAAATSQQRASHEGLESHLRAIAQSAGQKGSIPDSRAIGTGRSPDFSKAKSLDARLGQSLENKRKLELELEQLNQQLAREGDHSGARATDIITFVLAGAGVLLAVVVGDNALGAIVAVTSVSIMQHRLGHGPSAFMDQQATRHPAIVTNRRVKGGVARILSGWVILATFIVVTVASPVLRTLFPFWSELLGSNPSSDIALMLLALLSRLVFWGLIVYGVILLITGYRRRSGG